MDQQNSLRYPAIQALTTHQPIKRKPLVQAPAQAPTPTRAGMTVPPNVGKPPPRTTSDMFAATPDPSIAQRTSVGRITPMPEPEYGNEGRGAMQTNPNYGNEGRSVPVSNDLVGAAARIQAANPRNPNYGNEGRGKTGSNPFAEEDRARQADWVARAAAERASGNFGKEGKVPLDERQLTAINEASLAAQQKKPNMRRPRKTMYDEAAMQHLVNRASEIPDPRNASARMRALQSVGADPLEWGEIL